MAGKRQISSLEEPVESDRPLKRTTNSESSGASSELSSNTVSDRDATIQRLSRLLDLTQLIDHGEIQQRFDEVAELLLQGFHLRITRSSQDATTSSVEYEILELEFYLWKTGYHEDPFTHRSDEQRRSGNWCVTPCSEWART